MSSVEDVVVRKVNVTDVGTTFSDVGRDSLAVATEFCRHPKWPFERSDSFVAVDDWGHGKVVAATPDWETHIGVTWRELQARAH